MTRWVRFPRAAFQYSNCIVWLYLAYCIMRTHVWVRVRLAATRHEAVALELASGECGAAIQPGTTRLSPRWTAIKWKDSCFHQSNAQRLTRIPGVMWEVASRFKWGPPRIGAAASGCNCHAGDQPGSGTRVYSQLPAGGSRLGFRSGLVGLGKDASAPTSTDRIASHQRTRFPKMAQMRRQEKTLGNGTSRLPSAPAPTTRTRHSSPAHRPDALETTTPQARGRSAEQSSPTPRRSSGSAGGRSAGGAPSGGRLSREGLWTVSLRAPFIKGAPLATRGPEFYARSSPRGGSSHFPSDSPINPGRHGEAALTQIQSVHPHSRTGRQLRAPAEPGHSRVATRAGYS